MYVWYIFIIKLIEPGRYVPLVRKNIIMMDTSAKKPEGKLSCMDVLSGTLWQSD